MALRSDWRRWAVMLALYKNGRQMSVREVAQAVEREGWDVIPNADYKTPGENAKLFKHTLSSRNAKERFGMYFEASDTMPIQYRLTDLGRNFVESCLLDNPNITPEKSHATNS